MSDDDAGLDLPDLMPAELPPHPRLFVDGERLARCRSLIQETAWGRLALERLLNGATAAPVLQRPLEPWQSQEVLHHAFRNALACHLTGSATCHEAALESFRLLTAAYLDWPLVNGFVRAAPYGLAESRFTLSLARVYDLLAAVGVEASDEALFLEALAFTRETTDRCEHTTCGNHNTWNLTARMAAGLASGDLEMVADSLHGWSAHGRSYYGLVHQLRHDLLSDGLHWERTPGYHFYTLMAFTEMAVMLAHVGVDIWTAPLPAQTADDGDDLHRAYGPEGTKCLLTAFDAPFYATLGDGELGLLHDSGLANLRGVWIWGPIYELAYQVRADPKYAWLLNRIERDYADRPERKVAGLPMSLQHPYGEFDFVRLDRVDYPEGRFELATDARISLAGVQRRGCSLFPVTGTAVLRTRPDDRDGSAAQLFWGPHSAGHQSPAALHLDLYLRGARVTTAPRSGGYEDAAHLTWVRTTIAHNTVTVDEQPMLPYDRGGESIWQTDRRRGQPSDGALELFQPGDAFHVCRASNEAVYGDVRLDRTVILGEELVIDVFRVIASTPHRYDYAIHVLGAPSQRQGHDADLGQHLGYRHLCHARSLGARHGPTTLAWNTPAGHVRTLVSTAAEAEVILAEDPVPEAGHELGQLDDFPKPHAVILRSEATTALFVSLWYAGEGSLEWSLEAGDAGRDLVLRTVAGASHQRWHLPWAAEPVTCESARDDGSAADV